ncbi:glycosyltransferase [Janibacter sp. G1551]|uniref:glycosyltransferase n=1 Tax=Janibacter sp. G1551 TaxID=3420440 RepID=UPI003D060873
MSTAPRVAAVIPCKDEADRIAETVAAVAGLPDVGLVVVVDDGSSDDTGLVAARAGALVVRHASNQGKAAGLMTGCARVAEEERRLGRDEPWVLLFVDGDLQGSAANLGPLIPPVLEGRADLTVANIPRANSSQGRGRVVRLARSQILAMTGREINQPLSGMRCLTREAYAAASPLASGWGVEAAMLVDVLRAGLRVEEVPVELTHRASGADMRGRIHRAKQLRDVAKAVLERRLRRG